MANNFIDNFSDEYKYFIENHLLKLLGIPREIDLHPCVNMPNGDNLPSVSFENTTITFSTSNAVWFTATYQRGLTDESRKLATELCNAFFSVSEFQYTNPNKRTGTKYSDTRRKTLYQMAIQNGICRWLLNGSSAMEGLLDQLETWAVQTYEGNKVTFGFIIDPTDNTPPKIPGEEWLTFLKSDFSALLTDSIHSVIQLDRDCGFIRYLSLTDNADSCITATKLTPKLPLRFTQSISTYVQGSAVGIFLLNNGDIILAKNGEIKFVKRNRHWLNFSFEAFLNSASMFKGYKASMKSLVSDIYATVLDVSFAHTGGIISIVRDVEKLCNGEEPILKPYDNLIHEPTKEPLTKPDEQKDQQEKELKRSVIQHLIQGRKFSALDRKLRSELTAMDGACILDLDGTVISFGAIIRSSEESSGGARSAASKTLSKHGMAVKISTDGYVELYTEGLLKFSIK